jgi:1,4-dihydroxy-2-naphthoate octaprenyltransferase
MYLKTVFQSMRPPFLLLTISCTLLAFSLAAQAQQTIALSLLLAVFFAALFAHIAVNTLNEYQDFTSGLDLQTEKTPFSGGSGALPQNPQGARAVLMTAVISIVLTSAIGLYLLLQQGSQLLLPGLIGLGIIIAYTRSINRWPWLCLIAPGIGFGLLMVGGSYFALVGSSDMRVLVISLVPFFLVNNLLLLNQVPDIEADKKVGRAHFPIRYGVERSSLVYLVFLLVPFALIGAMIMQHQLPALAWIAMLPLFIGLFAWRGARRFKQQIGQQPQYLAANVAVTLLTPMLLAVSIYFG